MFQDCNTAACLTRWGAMLVQIDRHLWLGRDLYDLESEVVCEDPCLFHFFDTVVQRCCEDATLARLLLCPLQLRERLLGCLAGYALRPNSSRWCPEHHLRMLLQNEARRFPQVWIKTEVVATLAPTVLQHMPRVAEWARTFTSYSRPMRMFVGRAQGGLILRYEQWILRTLTQRTETVLAYRTCTDGVCTCCHRPAFWKRPGGERGCSSYILRLVAEQKFQEQWRLVTRLLSYSKRSRFEQLLLEGDVDKHLFEWCFCDPDCLSCSCDRCALQRVRAGDMCPADTYYVNSQLRGQDSPRKHSKPLLPEEERDAWFVVFDRELLAAADEMSVLPRGS